MTSLTKKIDIGFVAECESWKLHARFFPSKVGGKPSWLNRRPPQPNSLKCGSCNEPLLFLCQIYAPIDDNDDAFHRTLFVFICKSGSCYKPSDSNNMKVFRCQLRRDNEFYPSEPSIEDEKEVFDDSKCPSLCPVCGCRGPSHCSKCKKVNYCSRSHQIYDWKHGHKEACSSENSTDVTLRKNEFLLPEWEIIIEEESDIDDAKEISVEEEMKYLERLIKEKKAGTLINESENELELYTNKDAHDKMFSKFKKRISNDPGQIIRYDRGGEPLWITSVPQISGEDVPNCQYCNGKRQFECQIMPQLLNFLDLDLAVNSIDWGILAIYTCSNNCTGPETPYRAEYLFKQDIVQAPTSKED